MMGSRRLYFMIWGDYLPSIGRLSNKCLSFITSRGIGSAMVSPTKLQFRAMSWISRVTAAMLSPSIAL